MIRADISPKNKYWIPKHRYYELKHFCLQYKDWKDQLLYLDELPGKDFMISDKNTKSDPTAKLAMKKAYFNHRIKLVEDAAKATDESIGIYILIAVTTNKSYEYMKSHYEIGYERDAWYDRYRKFFYILHLSQ